MRWALTSSLVIRSVGEMWISDAPEIIDIRSEAAQFFPRPIYYRIGPKISY